MHELMVTVRAFVTVAVVMFWLTATMPCPARCFHEQTGGLAHHLTQVILIPWVYSNCKVPFKAYVQIPFLVLVNFVCHGFALTFVFEVKERAGYAPSTSSMISTAQNHRPSSSCSSP